MGQDDGPEAARSQEYEGRVPAEQGRISKLDDRPQQSWKKRRIGVRQSELVEMMDVGDPKIQWCGKDKRRSRQWRCHMIM